VKVYDKTTYRWLNFQQWILWLYSITNHTLYSWQIAVKSGLFMLFFGNVKLTHTLLDNWICTAVSSDPFYCLYHLSNSICISTKPYKHNQFYCIL